MGWTPKVTLLRVAMVMWAVALVFILVGVVYLTVPEKSLVVLPGHVAGSTAMHTQRGSVALAVGVLVFIGNGWAYYQAKRTVRRARRDRPVARPEA